jgi:hypothetical protein
MTPADYNARTRHLRLNVLAGFSLMLCVLTGVMWVRSYFVTDYYQDETQYGYRVDAASEDGYIAQWVIRIGSRPTERAWLEHHCEGISLQVRLADNGGVRFDRPYWNMFLLTAIVGFWPWLRRLGPIHIF